MWILQGLLCCGFDSLPLRHCRQLLDPFNIQTEPFGHTTAVVPVGLEKDGCLAQLDPFLRLAKVSHDVPDQVLAVLILHHLAVKGADLHEIVVRVGERKTRTIAGNFKSRLACCQEKKCCDM